MLRFNVDVSFEDVGRVKNSLDPIDAKDLVTLEYFNTKDQLGVSRWQQVTYSGDLVSYITYYSSSSFITANRIYRNDFTYSGDVLTVEVLKKYDTDGTTILKTYTRTHSYSGDNLTSSGVVIT